MRATHNHPDAKYPALTADLFSQSAHKAKNKRSKSPAEVWNHSQHKETSISSCVFQEQREKAGFVTEIISWDLFTAFCSGYWQGRKFSLEINNQMWELGNTMLT